MITVIMLCVFFFLLEMNGIFSVCLCAERRSPLLTDGVRTAPGCMMDPLVPVASSAIISLPLQKRFFLSSNCREWKVASFA